MISYKASTATWAMAILLFAVVAGCQPDGSPAANQTARSPEAKFELIVERFTRRFCSSSPELRETSPTSGQGTEYTQFRLIVSKPTYVVHPPQDDSQTYTAELTVRGSTQFSVRNIVPPANKEPANPLNADAEETGKEQTVRLLPEDDTSVRSNQFARTFDFSYEKDRWVLTSRDVPEAVQFALDYALQDQ